MKQDSIFADDQEVINALTSLDQQLQTRAMAYLYEHEEYRKLARSAFVKLDNDTIDFDDVFQESLTAFILNIMQNKFRGESQLTTYFYQICRFTCLRFIKKQQPLDEPPKPVSEEMATDLGAEHLMIEQEDQAILQTIVADLLSKINEKCRRVLLLRQQGHSMKEIAKFLMYDNVQSAKNKAQRCREKLRRLLLADPKMLQQVKSIL